MSFKRVLPILLLAFTIPETIIVNAQNENLISTPLPSITPDCTIENELPFVEGLSEEQVRELFYTDNNAELSSDSDFPSYYSSVDLGYVTGAKDQQQFGLCWAFSVISAIETNLIKKGLADVETVDFSERHLGYFAHSRNELLGDGEAKTSIYGYYGGDNPVIAGQYLMDWQGVANESDFPFPPEGCYDTLDEKYRYVSEAHVEDFVVVARSSENIQSIKKAIMDYGSVASAIYSDYDYMSSANACYYMDALVTNHSITIVGWDDNYSLSNFEGLENVPKNPGAWLVKNSWGKNAFNNGFMWLSYETPVETHYTAFNAENADNYDILHHYDGAKSWVYVSASTVANVFTASENQYLEAVTFDAYTDDIPYEIQIYKNPKSGKPNSGSLAESFSGNAPYLGCYTAELPDKVYIEEGETFSVVVSIPKGGYYRVEGSDTGCTSNAGESYIYKNSKWYDASTYEMRNFDSTKHIANNVCIKALSSKIPVNVSFEANGGSETENQSIKPGSKITLPKNPTKENAYFAGWYTDKQLTQLWDFENDTVFESTTLYAKWSDTPIFVESIKIICNKTDFKVGATINATAKVYPYYATNQSILWSTNNETVTILEGKLYANAEGTATVKAIAEDGSGIFSEISVNVYQELGKPSFHVNSPIFKEGEKITYYMSAENATDFVLYFTTPEGLSYRCEGIQNSNSIVYTYAPGKYTAYIIAADALGNTKPSETITFNVISDEKAICAVQNGGEISVRCYNSELTPESKLVIADYKNNKMIKIRIVTATDSTASFPANPDADTSHILWISSANNISPITEMLSFTSDTANDEQYSIS